METAWGDCPNTHSSGLEEHVACTGGAPQTGMLSSVRIVTFIHSFISNPPTPSYFLHNSLPSADDMAESKHSLRNGKKVGCILLKMSVYVKIKDKPSVRLRKMRGFHTHHAAGICFRLNPNMEQRKINKWKLCVFN